MYLMLRHFILNILYSNMNFFFSCRMVLEMEVKAPHNSRLHNSRFLLFSALHLHRWDPYSHDPIWLQNSKPHTNVPGDMIKKLIRIIRNFTYFCLHFCFSSGSPRIKP